MDRSCWWAIVQGVTKSQTRLKLLTMHAPVYTYCMPSCLVASNSLPPHGTVTLRLLCPWNFLGKNIRVGCHFLPGYPPDRWRDQSGISCISCFCISCIVPSEKHTPVRMAEIQQINLTHCK